MGKYNFFDVLEQLSTEVYGAVEAVCEKGMGREALSGIGRRCDGLICQLEHALFAEFMPPLERDGIAASAHCLSRVPEIVCELAEEPPSFRCQEEGRVCVRLAALLHRSVSLLRRIRNPSETPDLQGYRALLEEGRRAHEGLLSRLRSGALPRSAAHSIILTGRLRLELASCFDRLVEIMLCNI